MAEILLSWSGYLLSLIGLLLGILEIYFNNTAKHLEKFLSKFLKIEVVVTFIFIAFVTYHVIIFPLWGIREMFGDMFAWFMVVIMWATIAPLIEITFANRPSLRGTFFHFILFPIYFWIILIAGVTCLFFFPLYSIIRLSKKVHPHSHVIGGLGVLVASIGFLISSFQMYGP